MKRNWKDWAIKALIRAIRTFAEAALAYIGTGAVVLGDVNWVAALSAGAFGFVTAILLALTGLPEETPIEKQPPDQAAGEYPIPNIFLTTRRQSLIYQQTTLPC